MIVEHKTITQLTVTEAEGHEPILVTFENYGKGAGCMTIIEGSQSNTAYWDGMGENVTIESFVTSKPTDSVLIGAFDSFGTLYRKVHPEVLVSNLGEEVAQRVGNGDLSMDESMRIISQFGRFTPVSDINGVQALGNDVMVALYGPMWVHTAVPDILGKHPSYISLKSRINVVKQAIASTFSS